MILIWPFSSAISAPSASHSRKLFWSCFMDFLTSCFALKYFSCAAFLSVIVRILFTSAFIFTHICILSKYSWVIHSSLLLSLFMPLLANCLHNSLHALRSSATLIHWVLPTSSILSLHLLLGLPVTHLPSPCVHSDVILPHLVSLILAMFLFWSFVRVHVSVPLSISGKLTVCMIFLFNQTGILRSFRKCLYSQNRLHPDVILWSIALLISFSDVTSLPKYLYSVTSSNYSASITTLLLGLLPPPSQLHMISVFFLFSFIPSFLPSLFNFPHISFSFASLSAKSTMSSTNLILLSLTPLMLILAPIVILMKIASTSPVHILQAIMWHPVTDLFYGLNLSAELFRFHLGCSFCVCFDGEANVLLLHIMFPYCLENCSMLNGMKGLLIVDKDHVEWNVVLRSLLEYLSNSV